MASESGSTCVHLHATILRPLNKFNRMVNLSSIYSASLVLYISLNDLACIDFFHILTGW